MKKFIVLLSFFSLVTSHSELIYSFIPVSQATFPFESLKENNSLPNSYRAFGYNINSSGGFPIGPMKFFLNNSSSSVNIANQSTQNPLTASAWTKDGWYAVTSDNYLIKIDTVTGSRTIKGQMTNVGNISALTYDMITDKLYAILLDESQSFLKTVNINNGTLTQIGNPIAYIILNLACGLNGNLYAINSNNNYLGIINKNTGVYTLVGYTGLSSAAFYDMENDPYSDTLYLITGTALRWVNKTTGSAIFKFSFPTNINIAGLTIPLRPNPEIIHTGHVNTDNLTGPYQINTMFFPLDSTMDSIKTKLFWSRNSTTQFDSVMFTNTTGNNWSTFIPGNNTSSIYRYYIRAVDKRGRVNYWPSGAPIIYHSFNAAPDTVNPIINHTPIPNSSLCLWPVSVTANVNDPVDYGGLDSVWVKWYKNIPSNEIIHLKLNNTTGNTYTAPFNKPFTYITFYDSIKYKIFAQDNSQNHNIDSTQQYSFKLLYVPGCLGSENILTPWPFNTFWHDSRTQMLFLANEIICNIPNYTNLYRIGFYVQSAASQNMNGFNIRIQNTTLSTLTSFVTTGWTNVYTGSYYISGLGWQFINLQNYFQWTGSNLLIEICFDNSSYTSATNVHSSNKPGLCLEFHTDGSSGCSMPTSNAVSRPNICFNGIVGIEDPKINLPETFYLSQNHPNPFNPSTKINFSIPPLDNGNTITLKIYNSLGQQVETILNKELRPGTYEAEWNGTNYSSGIYFYSLYSNGQLIDSKKMVLMK